MKKMFIVSIIAVLCISLTGCGSAQTLNVNVENPKELNNTTFGRSALILIGDSLYYDLTTGIVYWWNGSLSKGMVAYNCDTTPSPYYAPNGLPYRYNSQTNTFEEIEREE